MPNLSFQPFVNDILLILLSFSGSHGNNQDIQNKSVTRYVSHGIWLTIKKIFPDAIERRIERVEEMPGKRKRDLSDQICEVCRYVFVLIITPHLRRLVSSNCAYFATTSPHTIAGLTRLRRQF
jgi:hypothetical protein